MSDLDSLLADLEGPRPAKTTAPARAAPKPANDDLDSLLNDLSTPVAAAPKKTAPAPKPAVNDDLDSLLSDLGSSKPVVSPAKTTAAPAPKKTATPASKPPADDLDSLLSDLGGAPKKSAAPAKSTARAPPADDLDSLLSDLGGKPAPAPAAKKAAAPAPAPQKAAPPADDLDSLLNDLGGSKPAAKPAAAAAPKQSPQPARPSNAKPVAAKPADDLDSLMADLGASPAPKKTAAPKPADDLDSLMADLGGAPAKPAAAKNSGPQPARPSNAPKPSASDDLDSLMADLGSPSKNPPPPSSKKAAAPKPAADELDSLMADLGSGGVKAQPAFRTQPTAASPARGGQGNELDSLMDSLSGPTSTAPRAKNSSNDLDALMTSLSAPASNTPPPARPQGRERLNSRFDELMGSVSQDFNDLAAGNGAKSRGICYHCRQPIYEECMQALGRTYHPEHFMCGSCNNPLGTGSFFELAGQAHCQRCYQLQFCPKCAHCNQAITDRCVTALDKKWHVHCFVCTQCTSPFTGNFFERDGRPYCDRCFHQVFAPRCRACNQPVLGDCVNALGAQWHPEHFNCQFCHKAFTGTFFEYEGLPYCEAHYYQKMGSSCAGCQQPISGASIDALGKKWHPEHFVCAFCMNKLEGNSYSEKNTKPYCRPCFGKLFGA